jgi:hypothetical protein
VLTFAGTQQQRISLFIQVTSGSFGCFNTSIRRAVDNLLVANVDSCGANTFMEPVELPSSDTYKVTVNPGGVAAGSANLSLYSVTDDIEPILIGGSAVVDLLTPGARGLLPFSGTQDQWVSLFTQITSGSFGCWTVTIRKSDNSLVDSVASCSATSFIEPVKLPASDTYTIEVNPGGTNTGTASLTLHEVVDQTGAIDINGAAVGLTLWTPGKRALLTFSGTQGQSVTASATVTSGSFGCWWSLAIVTDTNTVVASNVSCSSGNAVGPVSLPATGTFKVRVDPAGIATGAGNVTLTSP